MIIGFKRDLSDVTLSQNNLLRLDGVMTVGQFNQLLKDYGFEELEKYNIDIPSLFDKNTQMDNPPTDSTDFSLIIDELNDLYTNTMIYLGTVHFNRKVVNLNEYYLMNSKNTNHNISRITKDHLLKIYFDTKEVLFTSYEDGVDIMNDVVIKDGLIMSDRIITKIDIFSENESIY